MLKIQISGKIGRTAFDSVEDAVENFMRNQKRAGYANTDALLRYGNAKIVDHLLGANAAHYVIRSVKRGDTTNKNVALFTDAHYGKFAVEHVTIQRAPKKVRPVAVAEAPAKPAAKVAVPKAQVAPKPARKNAAPKLPVKWNDNHEQQLKVLDAKARELIVLQAIMTGAKNEGLSPAAFEQKQMRKISLVQTTYEKALEILKAQGFKITRKAPNLDNVADLSDSCGYVKAEKKIGKALVYCLVNVVSNAEHYDQKLLNVPIVSFGVNTKNCNAAIHSRVQKLDPNKIQSYGANFAKRLHSIIEACGGTVK